MKIAIIGSEGIIGRNLVEYLCESDCSVFGYDLLQNPSNKTSVLSNYTYSCVNDQDISYEDMDSLVILAAKRPVGTFTINDYYENIDIVKKNVIKAVESKVKSVVFASSISVYSGCNLPYFESDYSIPLNLYGASKSAGEQLGLLLTKDTNTRFRALRFAHVIGLNEKKGFLIRTLIDNAVNKKTQLIYGSGEQLRHYIYLKDVCRAILKAVCRTDKSGVYNIGMEKPATNLELALCVNKAFGNEGNLKHDYSKEMIGINDEMSVDKAKSELGFAAQFDLESTLKDLAESINNNG